MGYSQQNEDSVTGGIIKYHKFPQT